MPSDAQVPERLWFSIRRAAAVMERRAEAVVMAETHTSLGTFMVLSVLHARREPVSQQAIADRLGLTKGTVSRLLEGAVGRGLVTSETASTSRREKAIAITPAGRELVDAGDVALAASELAAYATDDPEGARAAIAALDSFASTLESPASDRPESGGGR